MHKCMLPRYTTAQLYRFRGQTIPHQPITEDIHMLLRPLLLLFLFAVLTACSSNPEDETAGMTVEELYTTAKNRLDDADYEAAINMYETLESRFPYGVYAEQAQLDIIYAYYKYDEPESAIIAAERFIKLHPNHPKVDYAYYLRGLASYDGEMSYLYRLFNQDISERDPRSARRAFKFFARLVKKFPQSRYTPDAIQRMHNIRADLAKYEIHVADFYMRRKAFVAAANRATYVVENFQGTPSVPTALGIMVESYLQLGLNDLASDALKVLKLNYPDSPITRKASKRLPSQPES